LEFLHRNPVFWLDIFPIFDFSYSLFLWHSWYR
jgi:hypothetical protein